MTIFQVGTIYKYKYYLLTHKIGTKSSSRDPKGEQIPGPSSSFCPAETLTKASLRQALASIVQSLLYDKSLRIPHSSRDAKEEKILRRKDSFFGRDTLI